MPEDLYGPPRVGGDVLSYCTKCRMELAHVIVSMIGSRPAKVLCKTCKSQHNYKSGIIATRRSPALSREPRKTQKTTVRVAEMWEQKLAEKKAASARPYNVKESFSVGDVIQHPKFGLGLVEEVRGNGKITVLFREDEKTLVHQLGGMSAT